MLDGMTNLLFQSFLLFPMITTGLEPRPVPHVPCFHYPTVLGLGGFLVPLTLRLEDALIPIGAIISLMPILDVGDISSQNVPQFGVKFNAQ